MTQDEIIKMARQAGLCYTSNGFIDWIDAGPSLHEITLFAKLVAAKEREACAAVAREWVKAYPHPSGIIANNIMARGEA